MKQAIAKNSIKRILTKEKVLKILKEDGLTIEEKNAENILELLYFLANLIVKQHFNNEDSRPLRSGKY